MKLTYKGNAIDEYGYALSFGEILVYSDTLGRNGQTGEFTGSGTWFNRYVNKRASYSVTWTAPPFTYSAFVGVPIPNPLIVKGVCYGDGDGSSKGTETIDCCDLAGIVYDLLRRKPPRKLAGCLRD